MTEQEAIQVFQELLDVPKEMLVKYDHVANEEQKEKINKIYLAEQMAIKALEKQIPREPVALQHGDYRCPSCNRIIRMFEAINFCMFCGQAVSWEE